MATASPLSVATEDLERIAPGLAAVPDEVSDILTTLFDAAYEAGLARRTHLLDQPTRIHTDYDDDGKIKGVREVPV